jgi:hypothetical protein
MLERRLFIDVAAQGGFSVLARTYSEILMLGLKVFF